MELDKEHITFQSPLYFGKGLKKNKLCTVMHMFNNGLLGLDGSVIMSEIPNYSQDDILEDLWSYIHYLWHENHTRPESVFIGMSKGDQASAQKFVETVNRKLRKQDHLQVTGSELALFINQSVAEDPELNIPFSKRIAERMFELLKKVAEVTEEDALLMKDRAEKAKNKFGDVQSHIVLQSSIVTDKNAHLGYELAPIALKDSHEVSFTTPEGVVVTYAHPKPQRGNSTNSQSNTSKKNTGVP